MSVQFNLNTPIFTVRPTVNALVLPFLNRFGLNYFQYLRCYSDGSFALLTNDTRMLEYFFQTRNNEPIIFSSYESGQDQLHSYWFLWDEKLPQAPVQMAREKCHFYHGITWVRRAKHYYDMIAVALSQERSDPGSFYLSILNELQFFVSNFEREQQLLVTSMDKHRILLATPYRDVNYQSLCLGSGKIRVMGKYGDTYMTTQELACLKWLLYGLTYKEIAQVLKISFRTVETYICRVKERTGCLSSAELRTLIPV